MDERLSIAVLGGGHGSFAAVADLSCNGHDVRWWRRDGAAMEALQSQGTIILKDINGTRRVRPSLMTKNIGEAIKGCALIFVPTPAFAQEDIARALAPHLTDGQVLFLAPGTFGSYAMVKALRAAGCGAKIAIGETGTLPYLARKHAQDTIAITVRAIRLPTGIFPTHEQDRAFAVIAAAFPAVHLIDDALSGALMNGGPIIHPPLILMNAGPLEHFDRWDIHNEGTQPAVRRVMDALDDERIALRESLGYGGYHYPLRDTYSSDRWMYGDTHKILTDSGDWREKISLTTHRYMTEDIHYGLAFLVSVSEWAGVRAPTATGLLAIASAICGKDLRHGPRTMEALGLGGLSRDAMRDVLKQGVTA